MTKKQTHTNKKNIPNENQHALRTANMTLENVIKNRHK